MSTEDETEKVQTFERSTPAGCRVETEHGTVYWISAPDPEAKRRVVREELEDSNSNTMILQPMTSLKGQADIGDKFKASLGGDLVVGSPFILEVDGGETRILSEVIVTIELGNIPEVIFA